MPRAFNEQRSETWLKKQIAKAAKDGFHAVNDLLMSVVKGEVSDKVLVSRYVPGDDGKRVLVREIEEIPVDTKVRVMAAGKWMELTVDKKVADKKEVAKPVQVGADVKRAVEEVAKRRQGAVVAIHQGGKA